MDLKTILKRKLEKSKGSQNSSVKNEQLEETYFKQYLAQWKREVNGIPKFFHKLPKQNELLRFKLRVVSRSNFLKRRKLLLPENDDLTELWELLDRYHSFPEEHLITYADFLKVANLVGVRVIKAYLTPVLFAKLQQGDPHGRVPILSIFNYVMRKGWLDQTRIGLSWHDSTGQGYLTEAGLENYITELLPSLPQLEKLEESLHNFYICTAVRKFLFFLDFVKAGRVKILDILASSFLEDLLELREEVLSKEAQERNWFSAPSALRIFGHYFSLDRDDNGLLSKAELASYGSGTLTKPFLDEVFQTCLTYGGEMDYKGYLDFVLALENRSEPQALAYLFRILDIKNCGYLDAFTLNYFYRAIQDQLRAYGAEPVPFEDMKDELFDMVAPEDPEKITLADLVACGQGDTFVSILIEFDGFWTYENRETISA